MNLKLILFLGSLFFFSSWFANPLDEKELKNTNQLFQVLKESKSYRLFLLDDFEQHKIWHTCKSSSYINSLKFIHKIPNKPSFQIETKEMPVYFSIDKEFSLQIHSSFDLPGRDSIMLCPNSPIELLGVGLPVKIFLWVYSQNYHIQLNLVLSNGLKDEIFFVSDLRFHGWRRLEVSLGLNEQHRNAVLKRKHRGLLLKGIVLKSMQAQKKGEFTLYLDRMYYLMDQGKAQYSGSEIIDLW